MKGLKDALRNPPHPTRPRGELTRPASLTVSALILLTSVMVGLTSCAGGSGLRGGKALITRGVGGTIQQSFRQSDNPAQSSRQEQETVRVRTYTLPLGARIEETPIQSLNSSAAYTNLHSLVLSAPMPVIEREETRAKTELGAAQKDSAREFRTKLSSLRGVTWIGVAMFLLGLASLVWPPLKVIVGSVTTSASILLGGLALMILPTLVVGNELLILGTVTLVVAAWFLAHRHGQLRGLLSSNVKTSSSPTPNYSVPAHNEPQSGSSRPNQAAAQ